jgi:hypothetical protein
MDDWAIATEDTPEGQALHEEIVHKFLDLLQTHSYFLKALKCVFEVDHVDFLGFQIHTGCAQIDPIKLDGIAQWPEELTNKKQIHQLLGVTGYQWPFIVNYAKLVLPLTKLLKNETPFEWTDEQCEAIRTLKQAITRNPRLHPPNLMKQFELHTDMSAYALGATLFQQDECGKKLMISAASRKLMEMERNYDVWDCEFMGFIFGLNHWKHLLAGTRLPVQVFVDHANLTYYCHPQKILQRVARYINDLSEYNFDLKHIAGPTNRADALSRRPDYNDGSNDNEDVVALPDHLFLCQISTISLWDRVSHTQHLLAHTIQDLSTRFPLTSNNHSWWHSGRLVVVENDELKREIVSQYHDAPTAGHPGVTSTLFSISQDYWWPRMKDFVQQYI